MAVALFMLAPIAADASGRREDDANLREAVAGTVITGEVQRHGYIGDGGAGRTVAVAEPVGSGLTPEQSALLPLVQGTIAGVFQRFSAMDVVDRQNMERIFAEQDRAADGRFSDDNFVSIGRLVNAHYVAFGTLSHVMGDFALEITVTNVETSVIAAYSMSVQVSLGSLRDLSAVRAASADILVQMGVELTQQALEELHGAAEQAQIAAENALANGIVAERGGGTGAAAMAYFFQAAALDPTMTEALNRVAVVSAGSAARGMVARIQNRVQEFNDWQELLRSATAFYADNLPFELEYDSRLREGNINFGAGTVEFSLAVSVSPNGRAWGTIRDIRQGYRRAAGNDWAQWQREGGAYDIMVAENVNLEVVLELLNDDMAVISRTRYNFQGLSDSRRLNRELVFRNVDARAMGSGALTIRVASVNGKDAQAAGASGFIRIRPTNLWGAIGWERFGAAWEDLRLSGKRGGELSAGVAWGGRAPVDIGDNQHRDNRAVVVLLFGGGYYWAPLPLTVLGLEARLGWMSASALTGNQVTNSDGTLRDERAYVHWFYGSAGPSAGFAFPLGANSRMFLLGRMEFGHFGSNWEGLLTPWPQWSVFSADLGFDFGSLTLRFSTTPFHDTFYDRDFVQFGVSVGLNF